MALVISIFQLILWDFEHFVFQSIKWSCGGFRRLKTVEVKWETKNGERPKLIEIKGSEKIWNCDIVLLALGFLGPKSGLAQQLGVNTDEKSNYKTNNYQTNISNVFSAGDMRRGQSLIVWAISEGREAAREVDIYLTGSSDLATKGDGQLPAM